MTTVSIASLPEVGGSLAGGRYAGVVLGVDGKPSALVLLEDQAVEVNAADAASWAASLGAQLPTRAWLQAILAAVPAAFAVPSTEPSESEAQPQKPVTAEQEVGFWTCEPASDDDAWFMFRSGLVSFNHVSALMEAVAVKLLPLA